MINLRLNIDEIKIIRNSLYGEVRNLKNELKVKEVDPHISAICKESIEDKEKIILYLSDKINAEER